MHEMCLSVKCFDHDHEVPCTDDHKCVNSWIPIKG